MIYENSKNDLNHKTQQFQNNNNQNNNKEKIKYINDNNNELFESISYYLNKYRGNEKKVMEECINKLNFNYIDNNYNYNYQINYNDLEIDNINLKNDLNNSVINKKKENKKFNLYINSNIDDKTIIYKNQKNNNYYRLKNKNKIRFNKEYQKNNGKKMGENKYLKNLRRLSSDITSLNLKNNLDNLDFINSFSNLSNKENKLYNLKKFFN